MPLRALQIHLGALLGAFGELRKNLLELPGGLFDHSWGPSGRLGGSREPRPYLGSGWKSQV
eukprot:5902646-Pyramimonas_sp.AAC.1